MAELSPTKLNSAPIPTQEGDLSWHNPPSSPFVSHVENDQENVAPQETAASTPLKQHMDIYEPQSAFKITSPSKGKSPLKHSSASKAPLDDFDGPAFAQSPIECHSPTKLSPAKAPAMERPASALSDTSHMDFSPAKSHMAPSGSPPSVSDNKHASDDELSSSGKRTKIYHESALRENEGLTVAMKMMEETHTERHETSSSYHCHTAMVDIDDFADIEDTEYNPDGPDHTSMTMDDTCFSNFSEMPNLDMTKFAFLKRSPTKAAGPLEQASLLVD